MKTISKFNILVIFIFPIIFTFYLNLQSSDNTYTNNFEKENKCSSNVENYIQYFENIDLDYRIFPNELSLYPEIENIKCLNKVMFLGETSSGMVNIGIGSSQNFYLFLKYSFILGIIIFWYLSKREALKELFNILIFFSFLIDSVFYLEKTTVLQLVIQLLIINITYILFNKNFIKIENIFRFKYRSDINFLRAIAVVSVIIYHADLNLLEGGWLGVDLFFIISGFLISNIIISELNQSNFSFFNFYTRRVKRILPALFSVLLLSSIAAYIVYFPREMSTFTESVRSSTFFYSNYFYKIFDFYTAESAKSLALLHTWSLSIEEQFYILFPIVSFILFKRYRKEFLPTLIIFLIFSIYLNYSSLNINDKFYNFELRVWEILAGAILMIFFFNIKISPIKWQSEAGFILVFFSVVFFNNDHIYSLYPRIIVVLGTSLILLANNAENNKFLNYLIKNKLVAYTGLISYSLYLFHQPIFAFATTLTNRSDILISIPMKVVLLSFTFVMAGLNYKLVEKSFLENKLDLKILLPVLLTIIIFFISSERTSGFVDRYDNLPEKVIEYALGGFDFNQNGVDCQNSTIEDLCIFNNNQELNIVGIGDSHLSAIGKYLSSNDSFNYIHIGENGCFFSVNRLPDNACVNKNLESQLEYISKFENSIFVLATRWEYHLNFYDSLNYDIYSDINDTLSFLLERNNKIIIISAIPVQNIKVIDNYLDQEIDFGDEVYIDRQAWEYRSFKSNNYFKTIDNDKIIVIDSTETFCNEIVVDKCIGAFEDKIFYYDNNHLTIEGAQILGDKVIKSIRFLVDS
jgi:peptidoglycan/LPS O-acetylase OafA/YrhL